MHKRCILLKGTWIVTYVNYSTQGPNCVRSIDDLRIGLHILHDTACDHDNIFCGSSEFLDSEIHGLPECALVVDRG